ncbi:ATP-binding cassette domain-containing protein, partial [Streptomyces sp. OfavH-34-F]|uniref:ATP-binding cassette domain-containing protein n=1 Tax=Streptomyces sp. OfavH-34-F TaxID=2917760 RepID=UPI001EF343FD
MRTAYSVSTVRAAEQALMARLPEGALMQRAAAGLAAACTGLLRRSGRVYGSRVVLLGLTGAGKTTLLRLLGGAEKPDTGRVVEGHGLKLGY